MAPLAGKPPFATDEPDSFYETPNHPQRRLRQPAPPDPNVRSSAYNIYDNYVGDEKQRHSGADALGLGLMNGSLDDDDEDDDDKKLLNPFSKESEASKHAMLAAATGARRTPSPPPQYIASPRPGYAAPISALNNLSRPEPAAVPAGRQPPNLQINASRNPFNTSFEAQREMSQMPVPQTPHPLQPPMTPITPVFARPRKEIQFEDKKTIMRSEKEGTTLPSRGEKGDEFWRRFSMVVKEEQKKPNKKSLWLNKTQNGTNRMSRLVLCIGIFLVIVAAGAIGLGYWAAHNDNSHNQPTAIGGSANEAGSDSSSTVRGSASASAQTSLHVSPTNTVARREVHEARATPVARDVFDRSLHQHKRHLNRMHDLD